LFQTLVGKLKLNNYPKQEVVGEESAAVELLKQQEPAAHHR
jgi:hypothetical protein